jgi:hypothetical protein
MMDLKIEDFEDLKKVGDLYDKVEDLILGSDLPEHLIEFMQKPFVDILEANRVDLSEQDF